MTFKTRLSVLLISTPILAFVIIGGFMGNKAAARGDDETVRHLRVFEDVVSLVMSNYVEEVKTDRVMEGAMRGLAEGLDPDSAYLTPLQVRAAESTAARPEGDLGIELTRTFYLRVIAARDHSPAAKAGLQSGDYVRAIDGKPTRDMSVFEGSRVLRGQPGSKVTLTVIRGNAAEPHEVVLVRERSAPVVAAKMLPGAAGYIRIPAFTATTTAEVRRHAGELAKAGATSLVIDVRRTAEGAIEHGIAAARLFVKSGVLAYEGIRVAEAPKLPTPGVRQTDTRDLTVGATKFTANAGDGAIKLPAMVLIAAGTAGAAEVFAAALDGNDRAELIGESTIGRAGVQKLVKLPENRGLWLTYARYLGPSGKAIHGQGLTPDEAVAEPDVEFGAPAATSDPVLDAALGKLAGKKAA
ncbi:MAG: PDZ domain-containing protein [Acidobacteria bacterium]|nr:PDZ domain-containing protein [Acidobacteriota bacterium]